MARDVVDATAKKRGYVHSERRSLGHLIPGQGQAGTDSRYPGGACPAEREYRGYGSAGDAGHIRHVCGCRFCSMRSVTASELTGMAAKRRPTTLASSSAFCPWGSTGADAGRRRACMWSPFWPKTGWASSAMWQTWLLEMRSTSRGHRSRLAAISSPLNFSWTLPTAMWMTCKARLKKDCERLGLDVVIQDLGRSRKEKRLIVFDMDMTIVDFEIINKLAGFARSGRAGKGDN